METRVFWRLFGKTRKIRRLTRKRGCLTMKRNETVKGNRRRVGGVFSTLTTALSASVLGGVAVCGAAGFEYWANGASWANEAGFAEVETAISASKNDVGPENKKTARDFLLSPTFFDEFFATDRTELIDFNGKTVDLNYASESDAERFSLDLTFKADCSTFDRFAISCRLENPEGIGSATLYFKSGGGWYSMTGAPRRSATGETTYLFEKGGYMSEGKPAGWDKIDAIRVSFWRGGPVDGRVVFRSLDASRFAFPILDVDETGGNDWVVSSCARSLSRAGFSVGRIDANGVSAEALRGRPCVFLPIAERIRPETVDALCDYVDDGGFVFAFYNAPEKLLRKLGFERGHYVRCEDAGFDVAEMRFDASVLQEATARGFELPAKIEQHSWALMTAEPLAGWEGARTSPIFGDKRARKLAVWFDKNGKSVDQPAILASPNGLFCSHIFLDEGAAAQATLVEAFVSAFDRNLERRRAWQSWRSIFEIGLEPEADVPAKRRQTLDALEKALAQRGWTLADVARLIGGEEFADFNAENAGNAKNAGVAQNKENAEITANKQGAKDAETAKSRKNLTALRADVEAIRAEFVDAYCRSLPSRAGEGRFWWEHSGFGIERGNWDKTAQALADAGFNGVVPNMLWGGVAYYRSEILPVAPSVEEYGDQIAAAVAACKKRGLETHIWKVCFNASNAPAEFLAEMRAQGRLQVSLDGEESPWLCPSHPANLELERAALEEVATKYDVDGIHLDYIRYPDNDHCFCDGCKERFSAEYERKTGRKLDDFPTCVRENKEIRAAFEEWRRSRITSLVRSIRKTLDEKRPDVALSAAVFAGVDSAKRSVAQDWIGWIDEGLLDFVCPMDYTADAAGFAATVRGQLDAVGGRTPVYPGIGMTATGISMGAEQVAAQVVEARKAGADGFTIFNLDPRTAKVALPALKKGATSEPTERLKAGLGKTSESPQSGK